MENPVTQFIYSVALELGYYDPDDMLEQGRPGQYLMWKAFYAKHPWGDSWEQTSKIIVELLNGIKAQLLPKDYKFKEEDWLKDDAFVPMRHVIDDEEVPVRAARKRQTSEEAMKAMFKAQCGF